MRAAGAQDLPALARFLVLAGWWSDPTPSPVALDALLADDHLARYLEGWGRVGDVGVVAEDDGGRPVGAAWCRRFSASRPGYGFLDEATPELSIAVGPDHRGAGLGGRLLRSVHDSLRLHGVEAVSLSVEAANPARRLYERAGYRPVAEAPGAITMRCALGSRRPS